MEDEESFCRNPKQEINSCNLRVEELEARIRNLEAVSPKKYPEVKFLTYKDRKRILVRLKSLIFMCIRCFTILTDPFC